MASNRRAVMWLACIMVPVVTTVVVALVWGWDLLIPVVASRASAALGRPVTIAHLHISPGRIVSVTADDVTVGNPPDWSGEPLVRVPRLQVGVDAWAYLRHGQMIVPSVALERPQVTATQLPNQAANYKLQLAGGSSSGTKIGEVRIEGGQARVRLAKLKADMTVGIATQDQGEQAKLVVDAQGTYNAQPITGRMIGGALLSLRDTTQSWPIDLQLQNGPTKVSLVGTMLDPMAFEGADLKLKLAGPDMSLLSELLGLPLPKTPNYQIAGQLDFANKRVQLHDFKARVGSSDLAGTIEVDPNKEPPEMVATLASRKVDLADLGGFIGTEPGRINTPGQSAAQRAQMAQQEAKPKLLPDTPINVPKLRWANVHLTYRGQSIQGGKSVPLDNLEVKLDIVNGQVAVHPISFGVGRGRISSNIDLAPQGNQTHAKADIAFQRVDVSRLMAATGTFQGAGAISGSAVIDSAGNSLAQMLGNGQGRVKLAMVGGDLSAVLVDLSGLHFGKALISALGLPERTEVACFITDGSLERGTLKVQALILDTGEAIITGAGGADLRTEQLDLQLKTNAKHFAIGSLPTPLNIGGTLKNPSIRPGAELAVRGGLAAGLGVAFPPLALLPTIQFGTSEEEDRRCEATLARARQELGGQRLPRPGTRQTER
jgi:AsmA family protein